MKADEEVSEPMNSAVKERLVTSIVVPPIPMEKKKNASVNYDSRFI
jgi:hypothetical protein